MATSPDIPDIKVTNNEADSRFEAQVGGDTAFAAYTRRGDEIVFTHTEVPPTLRDQGVGGALVRAALEHLRDENVTVVPQCPFVAAFIDEHPEFQPLLEN